MKQNYLIITYDGIHLLSEEFPQVESLAYFTQMYVIHSPLQLDLSALNLQQLQKFSDEEFELKGASIRKWKIV